MVQTAIAKKDKMEYSFFNFETLANFTRILPDDSSHTVGVIHEVINLIVENNN